MNLAKDVSVILPESYDSRKLRGEVDLQVSALAAAGEPLNDPETFVKALDAVAARYDVSGPLLSQTAHVADWMKKRRADVMKYAREMIQEDDSPALPGMAYLVKLPRQLLIDDEVVDLGDSRLTLSVVLGQLATAIGITQKEAEAYAHAAAELWDQNTKFRAQLQIYEKVVTEATKLYHVGPDELIYDRKKKAWAPR